MLLTTLAFLFFYTSQFSPTSIEVLTPRDLVEVELASGAVGSYLWVDRSRDVIVQAFILFAAALGGLLFFRAEGW